MESDEGFLTRFSLDVGEDFFLVVDQKITWLIDGTCDGWHALIKECKNYPSQRLQCYL